MYTCSLKCDDYAILGVKIDVNQEYRLRSQVSVLCGMTMLLMSCEGMNASERGRRRMKMMRCWTKMRDIGLCETNDDDADADARRSEGTRKGNRYKIEEGVS